MTLLDEPEPSGRRSALGDALIVCGNADPDLATRTGERGAYVGLGVSVIAVAVVAAATAVGALHTTTELPWWALVPIGLFWGAVLFAFDRGVILGAPGRPNTPNTPSLPTPPTPSGAADTADPSNTPAPPAPVPPPGGRLRTAVPYLGRAVLSLFIGVVVADFACMVLFAPDIEARLAEVNATRYTAVVDQEREAQQSRLAVEEAAVRQRTDALAALDAEYTAAQRAADEEGSGSGGTGRAGQGEVWQRKQAHADTLRTQRDAAAAELAAARAAFDKRREQVAADAERQRAAGITRAEDVHRATGLLSRHGTMMDLVRDESGALAIFLMITLVFLAVDLLPVVGKLMTSTTAYERERAERAREVLRQLALDRRIRSAGYDRLAHENGELRTETERARARANHRALQREVDYELELTLARMDKRHADQMRALAR